MARLTDTQREWLARQFEDCVRFDAPLASFTSFRIGGPAEALAIPKSRDELISLVAGAREREIGYLVFGGGTNLLVTDRGISGLVIRISQCLDTLSVIEMDSGRFQAGVGAGVLLKRFCRYCLSNGYKGMNFAVGIPGTVGGAIMMNAGTASGCMADALTAVWILKGTGEIRVVGRESLSVAYRRLSWQSDDDDRDARYPSVILGGDFLLTRGEPSALKAEARRGMTGRKNSQPLGMPSAGCVFKNPAEGYSAGRLIDMAGLKGSRRGGAVISNRHANYIVNTGGATAEDVLSLMALIQEAVWNRFQLVLEPEVKVVGD